MRKAIIIGGGPVGLATALRLHQTTNIQCTVYELRLSPQTIGGAIGIMPNGLRLLFRLGLRDELLARGSSSSITTAHSLRGSVVGTQDFVAAARDATGVGYLRIKRRDLQDVLIDAVKKAEIPVHYNHRLTAINNDSDKIEVRFSDESVDSADILIGCDGIHSTVRKKYVDPDQSPTYTGFSGLFTMLPVDQLDLPPSVTFGGIDVTFTKAGALMAMKSTASGDEVMFGFSKEVPLPESGDNRDGWEVHGKEEVEGFKTELSDILRGARGDWATALREMVDKASMIHFYPVYRLPQGRPWSKDRCILLGDAAHAMSPHAGQGLSMGLEDAFFLSRLLEDENRSLVDIAARFDDVRRPRCDEFANQAAKNVEIRKKSSALGLWFKEFTLWAYMTLGGEWATGLQSRMAGQPQLTYDIDDVSLWEKK